MAIFARTALHDLDDQLTGRLLQPGDDGWDRERAAFNLLVDQQPTAIALPADVDDIARTVVFAAAHGLAVAPQLTGHNAGALGACLRDTIIVKPAALDEVTIDVAARRARVGAGARWRDVVAPAAEHGLAALHGSSLDVGVVGYSLGGGLGWYARRHGLQAGHVRAVELVLADGTHVRADADHEPELFWAVRGGGGNFGVVTAIEFDLFPVDQVYAGSLFFPIERAAEVLHAWRDWLPSTPDELTSVGRLLRVPDMDGVPDPVRGRAFVLVEAAFLGDEADGAALLAPLRALGPELDTLGLVPAPALGYLHMDPEEPSPGMSAHALLHDAGPEVVDALLAVAGPDTACPLVSVELRQLGGALARDGADLGALPGLAGDLCLFAIGVPMGPDQGPAIGDALEQVTRALAPYDAGRYLSFVEAPADTIAAYPAAVRERLRAARRRYDRKDTLRANHRIEGDGRPAV